MDHTDFVFDAKRFLNDSICSKCGGTGRGRTSKPCRACNGTKEAGLDHPRRDFNSGYHDARLETRLGNPRAIWHRGPHDTRIVSVEFSWWYAAGYAFGLRDATVDTTTSEPAWIAWSGLNHMGERAAA